MKMIKNTLKDNRILQLIVVCATIFVVNIFPMRMTSRQKEMGTIAAKRFIMQRKQQEERKQRAMQAQEPAIVPLAPPAINDVIMILDPTNNETIDNSSRALVIKTLEALQEEAAPIIISSNVLETINHLRKQIGDKNLQLLRDRLQRAPNLQIIQTLIKNLPSYSSLTNQNDEILLPILSIINLNNDALNCYLHTSANLALLIPKRYIQTNIPQAVNLNPMEQAKACGFNPAVLSEVNDLTAENLLQKLQFQQSTPKDEKQFITSLAALFTPQKETRWDIYLVGHGKSGESANSIRRELNSLNNYLVTFQQDLGKGNNDSIIQKDILFIESEIKDYEKILEKHTKSFAEILPETARMAGLSFNDLVQFVQLLNEKINIAFLHYVTCFGGGYNQTLLNEVLSSLHVNFIVSSEGIDETSVQAESPTDFVPNNIGRGLVPKEQHFSQFFKLLRLFFDKPEEFVKIKGEKKDPLTVIMGSIVPTMTERNQPSVRIPAVGVFGALSLNESLKNLTQTVVTVHEIENKPIDFSNDTKMKVLIVNPSRINVPINFGAPKNYRAIVSPTPKTITPAYQAIHIFKEVNFESTLQSLFFNLIYLNVRHHPQTFIINKLTGINYEQSNLPVEPGKKNIIRNFIAQIRMQRLMVAFELNGTVYQCGFGIKEFTNPDELLEAVNAITFTSEQIEKVDMEKIAHKFISPKEFPTIETPITFDSIIKYFDSKIDTQSVITKETQSQSRIGINALKNQ